MKSYNYTFRNSLSSYNNSFFCVCVFLFPLSERFSGWCLCCCPLSCGSSRFRSVTKRAQRSRKVCSSSAWCCPSCCRKPSASVTTSCSSKSQRSQRLRGGFNTPSLLNTVTINTSFIVEFLVFHVLHYIGRNLLS